MDRGIPTEAQLTALRASPTPVKYLVGTPRAQVRQTRAQWEALPWTTVRDTVEVKLFQQAGELYDGHYLLRSNLSDKEPEWLWQLYMLLVRIEGVFRCFKNDLGLRPIYHQTDTRVEAHILVCFLAYCLWVTLQEQLRPLAPGL